MTTTPTGIPITLCDQCKTVHPTTRSHCLQCGYATVFLDPDGVCIICHKTEATQ